MNFVLERISDPAVEPVSLHEARLHLRVDDGDASLDSQIEGLIVNAREWVEDETGHALIDQQWRLSLGCDPFVEANRYYSTGYYSGTLVPRGDGGLYLRRTPILEITKFVSIDAAGTETDIDTDSYVLRNQKSKWPRIVALNNGMWTGSMVVEFRAGYVDLSGSPTVGTVPRRFKQSILLHTEAHFDRDEKMMDKLIDAAYNNVSRLVAQVPLA